LEQLVQPEFWARWIAIVILDITLAGDNALVIALAVRHLPSRQQWQGRVWGTAGAVVLRVLLIAIVTVLLDIPFLQAGGGLLLLWIAVKLLTQEPDGHAVRHGATLVQAIWIIVVADLVMSLDNVLAVAAAAHGDLLLVVFGVGLSVPIVVWGSGLLARLMARFHWIVDIGAGILGWVGGEMVLKDPVVRRELGPARVDVLHWVLPAVLALGVVAVGRWIAARRSRALDRDEAARR
jgi:YjbE family integral membrane protein